MVLVDFRRKIRQCHVRNKHLRILLVLVLLAFFSVMTVLSRKLLDKSDSWEMQPMVQLIQSRGRVHIQDLRIYQNLHNWDDESYLMMNKARDGIRNLFDECEQFKARTTCPFTGTHGNEKLLTLFTSWTYIEDKFPINNRTLHNWKRLPGVQVVVFVGPNDTNVVHFSRKAGWDVMPISKQANGSPVLSNMFLDAKEKYKSRFYGYANGDILFTDDFTETLKQINCKMQSNDTSMVDTVNGMLIVGRRMNVLASEIDDDTAIDWVRLRDISNNVGKLFRTDAEDYFITDSSYPWNNVSPVVVGRIAVDNWIVAYSRLLNITVIDATESILAVHQTLESRGNFEGHSAGNYNKDLIDTLNLPIVYAWGRTECTRYKSWFDLCGRLTLTMRKVFNDVCSKSES